MCAYIEIGGKTPEHLIVSQRRNVRPSSNRIDSLITKISTVVRNNTWWLPWLRLLWYVTLIDPFLSPTPRVTMTCSRSLKEQLDAATESPYPASMLV